MATARELRTKLNISQEELARRVGVSYRTIHRWENGEPVGQNIANRIAKLLGISLDEISGITLSTVAQGKDREVL